MDDIPSYSAYYEFIDDHKTFGYKRLDDAVIISEPSRLRRALHMLSEWFAFAPHKKVNPVVKNSRVV